MTTQAFDVSVGLLIDGEVGIFKDNTDPSVGGFPAPIGSLLLNTVSGTLYIKTAAGDTAWSAPPTSEASINHTNILNVGTNTHAQLDTFKANEMQQNIDIQSSGLISGGGISNSAGIVIDIAAGTGYVNTGTTYNKITWNATNVSTINDGLNYIGINNLGIAVASLSPPPSSVISLGQVWAGGGNTFIFEVFGSPKSINTFPSRMHDLITGTLGAMVVDGNTVVEQSNPNYLKLIIDAGTIASRLNTFDFLASTSFTKVYLTTDAGWVPNMSSPDTLDVNYWNDRTQPMVTALTAMTPGFWKKDVVFRTTSGAIYCIYGDREYVSFAEADTSPLPTIPAEVKGDAAYLAAIVIQQGQTSVASNINDIRPIMERLYGYGAEPVSQSKSSGYSHITHQHIVGGLLNSSTGLVAGGSVTINGGDNSKFDLSAGSGFFIDNSVNPLYPTHTLKYWPAASAVTVINLATQGGTYVGIDSTGAIIQSAAPFKFEQTRTIIPLAYIGHPNNTSIIGILPNVTTAFDPANRLNDLITSIGVITAEGNIYSANGANLSINKTSGKSFSLGANFHTNTLAPDITSDPPITLATLNILRRDGSGGFISSNNTTIDVTNYDNGTGTLAAIPASDWVSIPIYYGPGFGTMGTYIQYPQHTFATKSDAIANTPDLLYETYSGFSNAALRAYLVVQQGATDLSDPAYAQFITVGKFGSGAAAGGGGGGGGGGGAPVDAAYIVTVANPTLTNEKVIGTDFFVSNTHVSPTASIVESKLALNFATHSGANDPTAGQKLALVGTTGTPGSGNRYVTDTDTRNSNARTPTSHLIIDNVSIGAEHTISGGVSGYVFKATSATTAQLMQLAHSELSGIGTNTHAQIDSHIASTSNPHNTTIANLNDTTITSPTNGNILYYDTGVWKNAAPGITSGVSPILQLYKENPSTPTVPVSSGTNSVAIGSGASSTATNAISVGDGTNSRLRGGLAHATGSFATSGDAQAGQYILRTATTNNTITEAFIDGTGGSERLVLPNNSSWTFDILITARRTDATGGDAGYRFVGVIKQDSSLASTSIVGSVSKTVIAETNVAWDVTVDADTTNGSLRIRATGENGKTIRWVARVMTVEVTN